MLISLPRLCPKDAIVMNGLKYLNMEEKIQEYMTRHMALNMCFLFRVHSGRSEQDELTNFTEDIVGEIASVRPKDVLIKPINKEYFEMFKDKLAVRIFSLAHDGDNGYVVDKIVRFESIVRE